MMRLWLFIAVSILLFPLSAFADCTSPATQEGGREYFTADTTYKLCDGTNWIAFNSDGTLGACTTTAEMEYDTGETAYKFCDGSDWQKLFCGDEPSLSGSLGIGGNHSCSIQDDGTGWCWGLGSNGQLGNGGTGQQTTPTAVSTGGVSGSNWTTIDGGGLYSCGLRDNGTGWCWGIGNLGQLGNGGTSQQNSPTAVSTGGVSGSNWTSINSGYWHACGLRDDGTAWCWGFGGSGRLGNGGTAQQNSPVAVSTGGVSGSNWISITTGLSHTCGVRDDGTGWCWGLGSNGELGNGGTPAQQTTPVAVSTGGVSGSNWMSIDSGGTFTCGVRDDGTGWCWGYGFYGQLGNGGTSQQNSPTAVSTGGISGSNWTAINTNEFNFVPFACGLRDDGTAWCWGTGTSGQLGNGGTAQQNSPTAVSTGGLSGSNWTTISPRGFLHTCGFRDDSTAWCWGAGTNGRLGDGGTAQQNSPVQVSSPPPATGWGYASGGGACSSLGACTTEAEIQYFPASKALGYCDGADYLPMAQ